MLNESHNRIAQLLLSSSVIRDGDEFSSDESFGDKRVCNLHVLHGNVESIQSSSTVT